MKRRLIQLVACAAVLSAASFLSFGREPNGLDVNIDGSSKAQAAKQRENYDLIRLSALQRAVFEVKSRYVEPDRIDYQRMLLAGLSALQRSVAPLIVRYDEGAPTFYVQINEQRRTFKLDDVDSPWALSARTREVFEFLLPELMKEPDLEFREIEYATVNGMLRTLDPHTLLLSPEIFADMQASTRGEFGGLGIVISIRDGHLTVIRPMDNTPASRAGIQRGDRIIQINDESTLNMPLTDAVNRLRGRVGSSVDIFVSRALGNGRYGPKRKVNLVRANIRIESVEHKLLAQHIGYIKINNFQGNTTADLRAALDDLHKKKMRGLVLDLRDNPGGLLDQAVKVADVFLKSGTIVATSSQDPREREVKEATPRGTEPEYPMIALINGSSASASEIVAGALKNHDRALVIGQRSFGKGSVQVLFNLQDGSALKLTVAQYLTPGDVSIQGVGIVPDIAIEPMTVDIERMDLALADNSFREADLRSHLTHATAIEQEEPLLVLRYYLDRETRRMIQETPPEELEENQKEKEFLTDFSVKLLSKATTHDRRKMLSEAIPSIEEARDNQLSRAIAELKKLGVDWSSGTDHGATSFDVEAFTDRSENHVKAGDTMKLTVRVKNTGEATVYRLRGVTHSDNRLFSSRELVFGKLAPGETREWSVPLGVCQNEGDERACRIPRATPSRADGIEIRFDAEHDRAPETATIQTSIEALPKPLFAYSIHLGDDFEGNGDGKLQRGERANLYLRIKNIGEGASFKTQANLRATSGVGVLLNDGRFELEPMKPGEERLVRFGFEILPDFDKDEVRLEATVYDIELRQGFTHEEKIPLAAESAAPRELKRKVSLASGARLLESPEADARVIATAPEGAEVELVGELDGYARIVFDTVRQPAWIASNEIVSARKSGRIVPFFEHLPPRIQTHLDSLVTRDDRIVLRGELIDDIGVRDAYIFAGANKVFYENFGNGAPKERAEFTATIPLHEGINFITVVGRERGGDGMAQEVIVIRRDGPGGELLETPKYDDELFGLGMNLNEPPEP